MKKNRKYIILIGVVVLLVASYVAVDSILFDGIKPKSIAKNGFQANLFAKENAKNKTAVVLIGGGQWGDYWGQKIAKNGLVGLSLPYIGEKGLPNLIEDIDLKYFENAIQWLRKQKGVNPEKIVVMGASRNAELALVIASTFPDIVDGVVTYSPSSVSWSNTVLPYSSDTLQASWTYKDVDIPYVSMDKISGNDTHTIKTLEYWKNGLSKTDEVHKASIKVELIEGPILLFSGMDDKVWPSEKMADMIEKRLVDNNFKYDFKNIKYESAGHLISSNPEQLSTIRTGEMNIDGKIYKYEYGGTDDGDFKAKKDAYEQVFNFLSGIEND